MFCRLDMFFLLSAPAAVLLRRLSVDVSGELTFQEGILLLNGLFPSVDRVLVL